MSHSDTDTVPGDVAFRDLALPAPLLATLAARGYETPTPIQAAIIPHLLDGCDVIGQAQTGTGKTAAFALPLLAKIDTNIRKPQVLVLAPTRELARQVAEACTAYGAELPGLEIAAVYGGAGYHDQNRSLRRGAQIVVGTPGRVMDHMERGSLQVDGLRCLVLDEADEMLRMGFIDDVEWVLERLPEQVQIALFSATMPREIRRIAQQHLHDPVEIAIKAATATASTIEQRYWFVHGLPKYEALARILEAEESDGVLVFTRTRMASVEVTEGLQAHGINAAALNGDMAQALRERTVAQLREGSLKVVVATDVAARGLDVDRLSHVINYDMPSDAETYVHRIGRTGRAGRTGQAILFVHPREKRDLFNIEKRTRQRITEMNLPSVATINHLRRQRFAQNLIDATGNVPGEFETLIADLVAQGHDPARLAAAGARLLHGSDQLNLIEPPPAARRERPRRPDSRERPPRNSTYNKALDDSSQVQYRLAVGHRHGTKPGMIVGAIANELGIPGKAIGHIRIHQQHSTVALPHDLPPRMVQALRRIYVSGQAIDAKPIMN
jgi:ATP-dependent RNA helicase DeaD